MIIGCSCITYVIYGGSNRGMCFTSDQQKTPVGANRKRWRSIFFFIGEYSLRYEFLCRFLLHQTNKANMKRKNKQKQTADARETTRATATVTHTRAQVHSKQHGWEGGSCFTHQYHRGNWCKHRIASPHGRGLLVQSS